MKHILAIFMIAVGSAINAQEVTLKPGEKVEQVVEGTYYRTPSEILNKFVGHWQATIEGKIFLLEIYTEKTLTSGVYIDLFKSRYCYDKEDLCDLSISKSTPGTANWTQLENGQLDFKFSDNKTRNQGEFTFDIIDESTASFTLKEILIRVKKSKEGFSIPKSITLIRQQ